MSKFIRTAQPTPRLDENRNEWGGELKSLTLAVPFESSMGDASPLGEEISGRRVAGKGSVR